MKTYKNKRNNRTIEIRYNPIAKLYTIGIYDINGLVFITSRETLNQAENEAKRLLKNEVIL
jgi:hypothetical protein